MSNTSEETQNWTPDIVWVLIYSTLIGLFMVSAATIPA
jgi:hypothetical protein